MLDGRDLFGSIGMTSHVPRKVRDTAVFPISFTSQVVIGLPSVYLADRRRLNPEPPWIPMLFGVMAIDLPSRRRSLFGGSKNQRLVCAYHLNIYLAKAAPRPRADP